MLVVMSAQHVSDTAITVTQSESLCLVEQVETTDARKLLRLIWCPSETHTASSAPAPPRSQVQQQSIWERLRPSEEGSPPEVSMLCCAVLRCPSSP